MSTRARSSKVAAALVALSAVLLPGSRVPDVGSPSHAATASSPPQHAPVQATFAKMPLRFEANAGQFDAPVRYLARARGTSVFLTDEGATLSLRAPLKEAPAVEPRRPTHGPKAPGEPVGPDTVLTLKVAGGREVAPRASETLVTKSNYFLGNDPSKWRTGVANYGRVTYPGVLDGVDLVYHGDGNRLEYDFVVAPGVDASRVALDVGGAEGLSLTTDGDLAIGTPYGTVVQERPRVYQVVGGRETEVRGGYRIVGSGRVAFEVAAYDHARPLVIDPVLSYATYLGGSNTDVGLGIGVDGSGNAYVAGYTDSTNFPVTANALQASNLDPSNYEGFVTEIGSDGTTAVYSTYLGGSSGAFIYGLAVDGSGHAFVCGITPSSDFPTTAGALQSSDPASSGTWNGFVTEVGVGGAALVYSTYLAGAQGSNVQGIALDGAGDAFVTGDTSSQDFPTTANAFQPSNPNVSYGQAFVTELKAGGASLVYSTFLGGSNDGGAGQAIAVDSSGNAYVTGRTNSTNFPTTGSAFQTTDPSSGNPGSGNTHAFVTKLNASGTGLVYSTYLGGDNFDEGLAIAVDGSGDAYVSGFTESDNFPVTPGAYGSAVNGSRFTTKIAPSGSSLVFSTGAIGALGNNGLALDSAGNAYLAAVNSSPGNFLLAELSADGSSLLFSLDTSSYFANGVALDGNGGIYVTGEVSYPGFATSGAYQSTFGGEDDAFVAKYVAATAPVISPSSLTIAPLGTQQFTATGGSGAYTWALTTPAGSGSSASVTTAGLYTAGAGSPTANTTDTITVTDTGTGLSASESITVTESLTLSPSTASIYPGGSVAFTATNGSGTYSLWSLPSPASGSPSVSPSSNSATTTYTAGHTPSTADTVQITDSNGATAQATVSVGVGITISLGTPSVPPLGSDSLSASGGDGGPYTWSITTDHSGGSTLPTVTSTSNTAATYVAGNVGGQSDTITVQDGHGNSATAQIAVGNGVSITPTDQTVAPLQTLTFGASGGAGAGTYTFAFASGGNASGGSITSAGAYKAGTEGNTTDTVTVTDTLGNTASTVVNVGPAIAIASPGGASTPPLGGLQFTVSGGYATGGYTWSVSVAESGAGAVITQSGAYTAGSIGGAGVEDTITVADTLGNSASVVVTVTAGVSLTPASITLPPRGAQTFLASGGSGAPYTWTMVQSPSGGGVDANGNYKVGTTSGVNDIVQAKDSLGNTGTASITVGPGVSITPTSPTTPPKGVVPLTATGGSGVYTWLVTTNNSVGATVSASGTTVNYTAGATGSVSDVVTVTDSDGNTATVSISVGGGITLNPNNPTTPPRGTITFAATNGNGAPYTWSIISTTGGTIVGGAYTAGSVGNATDIVSVSDSLGNTASTTVTITAGLSLTPPSATLAPLGTQSFGVKGGSGAGYVWTMQSAPSGGSVVAGNYVAGPTGSVTDVVLVTDSLLNTTTASVTVTAALALSPTAPTTPPRGSITFGATGGAAPYAWSIQTNGSGANINAMSGAYTAGPGGGTSDTVLVTDNNGATASTTVTVTAGDSIAPASPSAPPLGSIAFTAMGGSGTGYTWAITSNHSGGSIVADTGAYTAGSTGSSNDTVQVTDSLHNTASVSVSVGGGVAISPFSPTIPPQGSQTFTATGGSGSGFTWKLTTSASGGAVEASTGAYKAGATGSTTDTLQVTDSLGNTTSTPIHVGPGVTLSPATTTVVPLGTVAFSVAGGSGSGYVWSMQSAPSGGGIDATGQYKAGLTGSVTDVVGVTDSLGNTATASVKVGAAITLAPATSSVAPRGAVAFKAAGGTGQYFFTLQTNASGASIGGSSGAYVAGSTPSVTDVVQVIDTYGAFATAKVNVGPAVTIAPANPAVAPLAKLTLTATGGSGTGFTWSLTSNQSGGSITPAGAYTAGATGKTVDIVRVVDSLGNAATATISVGGGLAINPTNPAASPRGAVAFTATGGAGGYAWSLVTSASGGTINSATGAYTAGSTGNVTDVVQVKDSNGSAATTSVKVGPAITVTPATVTVGTGTSVPFGVQGGSGSGYVWSLTTNASGGTINGSTGVYVAGNTGGVTDVVGVTDSLGNTGGASVTVKGAAKPGGDGGGGGSDASAQDAASGHDGAPIDDAGFAFDGSGADGSIGSSGGAGSPSSGGGCSVVGPSASNLGGALGALLGFALIARRRRRR